MIEQSVSQEKQVKITRYGAYGMLCQEGQILLTLKKSGPYKFLWDLPGGAIEFGESPEEALKREFLEEVALEIDHSELICTATSNLSYRRKDELRYLHHVGIIYKIIRCSSAPQIQPEEEFRWVKLIHINLDQLTPFAKHVLTF